MRSAEVLDMSSPSMPPAPEVAFGAIRLHPDGPMVPDAEAARILGFPEGAGQPLPELGDLGDLLKVGAEHIRAGAPCFNGCIPFGEGTLLELLLHGDPDANSGLVYALVLDVTRRRQREEHIHRVQRLEALSDLAGGLAHEFNNVVTAILGLTDLLVLDARDTPSKVLLGQIQTAARRGIGLTGQLLTFSRQQPRHEDFCDPSVVFASVVDLVRQTFPRSIEVVADLHAGPCSMASDASQLRHAFLNLALNARDALQDNQGVVLFRSSLVEMDEEQREFFPEAEPGRYLLYEVGDTGRGIPPSVQQHLFQPFFTTQEATRTGLGLATTYGIVRGHGGQVTFVTEPGVGTRFLVLLPFSPVAEQAPPRRAQALPRTEREKTGNPLILFVDDEEAIRLFAGAALRRKGYRVVAARNGVEAVELMASHRGEVELVLLDLTMPQMAGPEAFEKLRELQPDLRVVVMSGYGPDERSERLLAHGALAFLPKPFDVHELLEAVESALEVPAPQLL